MKDDLERKQRLNDPRTLDKLNNKQKFGDLESLINSAQQKNQEFETELNDRKVEEKDADLRQMGQSRKAYYRELKKVIEASDVVIQVLDARDPQGCRSTEIE
mgnify:CR=1 FL=1|jgi:nuclear GTP-binding protein